MPEALLLILVPLGIVAFSCFVLWLIATLAGWRALAAIYYASQKPTEGRVFHMQSGQIGIASYSGCLTIRVSPVGIHLSVFPLFRFAHPPLFIPWSELHDVKEKRQLFWRFITVKVGTPPVASLTLPRQIFEEGMKMQQ